MKMMETERIERYVNDLLEVSGVCSSDEAVRPVRRLLHHLYTAVAMYELMGDDERGLIACIQKKLRYFFTSRCDLKERKRNKEKANIPPTPPIKEKENKEKAEKKIERADVGKTSEKAEEMTRRNNAFYSECMQYSWKYGTEMVTDFYSHWSEMNMTDGKMLFEYEKTWNTARRLRKWSRNEYTLKNATAAIRLKRAEKMQEQDAAAAEQLRQQAAMREQAEAQQEAQAEQARQEAGGLEEYIRDNPDSTMARIAREREARERKKQQS